MDGFHIQYLLVVQRMTKLTVRIILRILSHGSNHFSDQQKTNKTKHFFFFSYWKLSTSIPQQKLLAELIKSVIKQEQLHKLQAWMNTT